MLIRGSATSTSTKSVGLSNYHEQKMYFSKIKRLTFGSTILAIVLQGAWGPAAANSSFVSSRPSSATGAPIVGELPGDVPQGATVLRGSILAVDDESRLRSCADVYGAPSAGVTYAGGPITESRYSLPDGTPAAWERTAGKCLRLHEEHRTVTCPTTMQGTIIERRTFTEHDDGSITADTGWVEQSRSCEFYKVNDEYEEATASCPSDQMGGVTQRRTFEMWSDGSTRNFSAWSEVARSCSYYRVSVQTESRQAACPSNQNGSITQQRTYETWSDGTIRGATAWVETARTCAYYLVSTQTEQTTVACPAGQTGSIVQQRSYQLWSDGSARNHTAWAQISNSCVTPAPSVPPTAAGIYRQCQSTQSMGACMALLAQPGYSIFPATQQGPYAVVFICASPYVNKTGFYPNMLCSL